MKNWRVNLILIIFFLLSATVIGRLVCLQILRGDHYKALSQGLHISVTESWGDRGEIFLKNGESLVINIDWPFLSAYPQKVKDHEETAEVLSKVVNLEKSFLLDKLQSNSSYLILKRKLSQEEVEKIKELNLEGIYLGKERGRYYPQEDMASQIIGFLGSEGKGQYGLEQYYNDILDSEKGFIRKKKGSDLILTIDYNVQFEAEKLLQKAEENLEIKKGQILVIEPGSGKMLAMAHLLNFDPNHYEKYAKENNLEIFKNKATQELFEPGSVFKTITMAAAIEENEITPKTTMLTKGLSKLMVILPLSIITARGFTESNQ